MSEVPGLIFERLSRPDAQDFAGIVALEQASFSNPWTPEALAEMLQSDVTRLYVARTQGRRVSAFCACWLIAGELHVNTVAVDMSMRRRGMQSFPEEH